MKQRIRTVTNFLFFFPLLYLFNATRTRGIIYSHDQINISCQRGEKREENYRNFNVFRALHVFSAFLFVSSDLHII